MWSFLLIAGLALMAWGGFGLWKNGGGGGLAGLIPAWPGGSEQTQAPPGAGGAGTASTPTRTAAPAGGGNADATSTSTRTGAPVTATETQTAPPAATRTPSPSPTAVASATLAPTATSTAIATATRPSSAAAPPTLSWKVDFLVRGSQETGYFATLASSPSGALHLAFFQETNDQAWYGSYRSGRWSFEKVLEQVGSGRHLALALDRQGNPILAFNALQRKKTEPGLAFLKLTGGTWQGPYRNSQHIAADADLSVAAGTEGDLHFSFLEAATGQVVYSHFTRGRYEDLLVGAADPQSQSFPLAVDSSNVPHLVYATGDGLAYATRTGGAWRSEVIDPHPAAGLWSALALDAAGTPHVAYTRPDGVWYAVRRSGGWQISPAGGVDGNAEFLSLALDGGGTAHLSYYEASSQSLRYASGREGAWRAMVVDQAGDVGQWNSLALDADGLPVIAYLDRANEDLKIAWGKPDK